MNWPRQLICPLLCTHYFTVVWTMFAAVLKLDAHQLFCWCLFESFQELFISLRTWDVSMTIWFFPFTLGIWWCFYSDDTSAYITNGNMMATWEGIFKMVSIGHGGSGTLVCLKLFGMRASLAFTFEYRHLGWPEILFSETKHLRGIWTLGAWIFALSTYIFSISVLWSCVLYHTAVFLFERVLEVSS